MSEYGTKIIYFPEFHYFCKRKSKPEKGNRRWETGNRRWNKGEKVSRAI